MQNKMVTRLLTAGWVWFYAHLINQPQAVVDLYEHEVDDINNALQCSECGEVFMAENMACPMCFEPGYVEMVSAPGQEATDFHPLAEVRLSPDVRDFMSVADRPSYIAFGMKTGEKMLDECANDCAGTLTAAMRWTLKQASKLLNTARLEYDLSDMTVTSDIESYVTELSDEFRALKQAEPNSGRTVNLSPDELEAIEEGASVCPEHHYIQWADDGPCPDCIRLGRLPDGPLTPAEYAQVLANRERVKAQQAWDVERANHDPEACGKFTDCEFCVEIEHDRMHEAGEIHE